MYPALRAASRAAKTYEVLTSIDAQHFTARANLGDMLGTYGAGDIYYGIPTLSQCMQGAEAQIDGTIDADACSARI